MSQLVAISCAERHISRLIQVNLERQRYSVLIWESVSETLESLASATVNLLVIDPYGAGDRLPEILATARRLHPAIKVIVLREKDDSGDSDGDLFITLPKGMRLK